MSGLLASACSQRCAVLLKIIFPLLLSLLFKPAVAQSATHVPSAQLLDEAVHILGGHWNLSVRWQSDIRYMVVNSGESRIHGVENRIFRELSQLSGISSERIESPFANARHYLDHLQHRASPGYVDCALFEKDRCANFVIVFASQSLMHAIATMIPLRPEVQAATASATQLMCFFSPQVLSDRTIASGFVYIDQSLDATMMRTCLQEELYQSFGLFQDYTGSSYFSFNNLTQPKEITYYDRALLASLYSNEYPAGTLAFKIARDMYNRELGKQARLLAETPQESAR